MAIRPAEQIIHKAAWLYYAHGLRQDQVAKELNISRASVAMYLRKARDTGIVNISTSTQLFTDDVLARQVEDALELDAVWIAPETATRPSEVPVLAASVFLELVRKGDRIGVAWGTHRLCHRRRHVLCRPAGCHRGAALRQSRRALFLPARPVHHGDRPAAQRPGHQFLRAAGAQHRGTGARPARRAGHPRTAGQHSPTATSRSIPSAPSTPTAMSSNAVR